MTGEECHKIWHRLTEATCEVIDARQALDEKVEKARLRAALEQTRLAEAEILKLLSAR